MLLIPQEVVTLIPLFATGIFAAVLEDASQYEPEAVHQPLTEEKMQYIILLLQNDVEKLKLRITQLERGKGADTSPKQEVDTSPEQEAKGQKQEIFFNARLSAVRTKVVGGATLIFDEVVEQNGEGYNASTGVFTAYVAGTYSFSLTILSFAHIRIMKNEKELGRTFAGSNRTSWPQTGAITLTTHLNVGDKVYPSQDPHFTEFIYGNNYASFSGHLIVIK